MSLFNKITKSFQWGDKTVVMETGEIARQATGAVLTQQRVAGKSNQRSRPSGTCLSPQA